MISGDLSENISLFISLFLLFYYRGIVLSRKQMERLMKLRQSPRRLFQRPMKEEPVASNVEISEKN